MYAFSININLCQDRVINCVRRKSHESVHFVYRIRGSHAPIKCPCIVILRVSRGIYRPISLTCIISKCMEHILVSNIMQHLDSNKILYALQHGFRKNLSCDTQILSLFQDLSSNPSQTDMIIMDFSKAFDKVPHRRLQYKLDWYGIRGSTHNWIQHFLQGRSQRVVSEGSQSSPILSSLVCPKVLFLARYYF